MLQVLHSLYLSMKLLDYTCQYLLLRPRNDGQNSFCYYLDTKKQSLLGVVMENKSKQTW